MKKQIKTIYLIPHAHTDIGYSHDPIVALELHDRFLDRAIELCEQTRNNPQGERFRWTVEVFFSALNWWDHRDADWHERFKACLRLGEIDVGARYLVGTELYSPEDIAWEMGQMERLTELTGWQPDVAIQNDVNGFPLTFARPLAEAGARGLIMGLNTTMGHSPVPRCTAFRWDLGEGRELLVWNGWIYNRLKSFCHIDEFGDQLPSQLDAFFASLPDDYPLDFAILNATMGDNVGPFPSLPEQVRIFNSHNTGVRMQLATFSNALAELDAQRGRFPVYSGNWPDFWTFGAGALPQMVSSLRRAQRRLNLVEKFRALGWANESGGTLTMDRARRAVAVACEHTNDSHTCDGFNSGTSDSLRQRTQVHIEAAVAESASMVLLRDHLAAMASGEPRGEPRVLGANPHLWPVRFDYLTNKKGMLNFSVSRRPEHLFQFDREPTSDGLAASGTFGFQGLEVPAGQKVCQPLHDLEKAMPPETALTSWIVEGEEQLDFSNVWKPFDVVLEKPTAPFQLLNSGMEDMDPSDCAWNPDLAFTREKLTGLPLIGQTVESIGNRLSVKTDWRFDADPTVRAYYLALPLALPGEGDCEYWVDSCGSWFRAETDQLPGSCNSFYQAYRGVAISRGGRTIYVASPDSTLFQLGELTFGRLPEKKLQRKNPFVALWIYNNYWSTNFASYSPGNFTARFLLESREGVFDPAVAEELFGTFDADYMTHPVS